MRKFSFVGNYPLEWSSNSERWIKFWQRDRHDASGLLDRTVTTNLKRINFLIGGVASERFEEQKNPPELPIGRFLKSKSLGGNRVIFAVIAQERYRDAG